MNLKNKKTVLGDDAALYSHKEDVSEKEKWENMSRRERLRYFADYYLGKIVITVIVLAVVGSIAYTMLKPRPETVLAVAVVNDAVNQPAYDELQRKFEEYISLNAEEQQTVFDTGYTFNNYDYQSWQKFSMYNMVGDLDVSILPMEYFEEYAPGEYFSPVAAHLSSSLYGALSEYLLETKKTDDQGNLIPGSETVFGIDLSSTWLYQDRQLEEPMVLVINAAPKNPNNIECFLNLLFFPDDVK
ncbi:MAG: hypothetical protein J6K04_01605 [Lachnospiraceae bacterium]|nr:hypothetical protein [Lachnospiraceae bacterium]MBP3567837.1 hypothetical protein [Lachnospiraceae bacterium]